MNNDVNAHRAQGLPPCGPFRVVMRRHPGVRAGMWGRAPSPFAHAVSRSTGEE